MTTRLHAVVLTGRGKAFTSGQDLREMAAIAAGEAGADAGSGFRGLLDTAGGFDKPLLAAVHGVGMGLGCTLLGHVDLVLMDEARGCGPPSPRWACLPKRPAAGCCRRGWGGSGPRPCCWPRNGSTPTQAVAAGLALRVCPEGTVVDETLALARSIAPFPARPPDGSSDS